MVADGKNHPKWGGFCPTFRSSLQELWFMALSQRPIPTPYPNARKFHIYTVFGIVLPTFSPGVVVEARSAVLADELFQINGELAQVWLQTIHLDQRGGIKRRICLVR